MQKVKVLVLKGFAGINVRAARGDKIILPVETATDLYKHGIVEILSDKVGSFEQRPLASKEPIPSKEYVKADLIAMCEERGIEATKRMTNAKLKKLLGIEV